MNCLICLPINKILRITNLIIVLLISNYLKICVSSLCSITFAYEFIHTIYINIALHSRLHLNLIKGER